MTFDGSPALTFEHGTFSQSISGTLADGFWNYNQDSAYRAFNGYGQNNEFIEFNSPVSLLSLDIRATAEFPHPTDNLTVSLYDADGSLLVSQLTAPDDDFQTFVFNQADVSKIQFSFTGGTPDFYGDGRTVAWYTVEDITYELGSPPPPPPPPPPPLPETYFVDFDGSPALVFANGTFSSELSTFCGDGFWNYARDSITKAYNGCGQTGEYILFTAPITLESLEVASCLICPQPSDDLTISLFDASDNFLSSRLVLLSNRYQEVSLGVENVSKVLFTFLSNVFEYTDPNGTYLSESPVGWYELKDIKYSGTNLNPGRTNRGGGSDCPYFPGDGPGPEICPPLTFPPADVPLNVAAPGSLALLTFGLVPILRRRRLP